MTRLKGKIPADAMFRQCDIDFVMDMYTYGDKRSNLVKDSLRMAEQMKENNKRNETKD